MPVLSLRRRLSDDRLAVRVRSGPPGPLVISGTPPAAAVGTAYAFYPGVAGGAGPKTYALSGTLPAGLSFSTANGSITGTPTTVGNTSGISITVTDTTGSAPLSGLSITVAAGAPTLAALVLSNATFTAGAAAGSLIGTISGQTAGSTLTFTPNDGRVAVGSSSLVVGMTAATAGTISGTVVETLAGATNSPRSTAATLTVNAAQVGPPAGFSYLLGANGDRLLGSDGAYLYGVS